MSGPTIQATMTPITMTMLIGIIIDKKQPKQSRSTLVLFSCSKNHSYYHLLMFSWLRQMVGFSPQLELGQARPTPRPEADMVTVGKLANVAAVAS